MCTGSIPATPSLQRTKTSRLQITVRRDLHQECSPSATPLSSRSKAVPPMMQNQAKHMREGARIAPDYVLTDRSAPRYPCQEQSHKGCESDPPRPIKNIPSRLPVTQSACGGCVGAAPHRDRHLTNLREVFEQAGHKHLAGESRRTKDRRRSPVTAKTAPY